MTRFASSVKVNFTFHPISRGWRTGSRTPSIHPSIHPTFACLLPAPREKEHTSIPHNRVHTNRVLVPLMHIITTHFYVNFYSFKVTRSSSFFNWSIGCRYNRLPMYKLTHILYRVKPAPTESEKEWEEDEVKTWKAQKKVTLENGRISFRKPIKIVFSIFEAIPEAGRRFPRIGLLHRRSRKRSGPASCSCTPTRSRSSPRGTPQVWPWSKRDGDGVRLFGRKTSLALNQEGRVG